MLQKTNWFLTAIPYMAHLCYLVNVAVITILLVKTEQWSSACVYIRTTNFEHRFKFNVTG